MQKNACPCFSQKNYPQCCQPYHLGHKCPEAIEILMRARFCAFALGLVDFIYSTSSKALLKAGGLSEANFNEEVSAFSSATFFEGLKILDVSPSAVTFMAYLREKATGRDLSFGEKSTFIREDGMWVYDSGELFELD